MTIVILSPKARGHDSDVYLQHLIDELKELWKNIVETYDASMKETFQLHTSILWTVNDFPHMKIYQDRVLKENLHVLVVTGIHGP